MVRLVAAFAAGCHGLDMLRYLKVVASFSAVMRWLQTSFLAWWFGVAELTVFGRASPEYVTGRSTLKPVFALIDCFSKNCRKICQRCIAWNSQNTARKKILFMKAMNDDKLNSFYKLQKKHMNQWTCWWTNEHEQIRPRKLTHRIGNRITVNYKNKWIMRRPQHTFG